MNQTALLEKITVITGRVLQERGISRTVDPYSPLNENGLGLDSMSRLSLLTELEQELNIEFPEEYWGSRTFENISAIVNYIMENKLLGAGDE